MTYTYAVLDVPEPVYATIRRLLVDAGYEHAFHANSDGEVIDMHGIALRVEEYSSLAPKTGEEAIDWMLR